MTAGLGQVGGWTMPGTGAQVAFYVLAAMAVVGALLTVTRRNPVTAVVCLVGTFFAIAGIYATLSAHFLAVLQVLVYAGAIMVLFAFVIMVLNREEDDPVSRVDIIVRSLGVGASAFILYIFARLAWSADALELHRRMQLNAPEYGTVSEVGRVLFRGWLFPFEAISLLLLVAIVGGVVLSQPRKRRPPAAGGTPGGPRMGPGTAQGGA